MVGADEGSPGYKTRGRPQSRRACVNDLIDTVGTVLVL
jgi:hypothetical protein